MDIEKLLSHRPFVRSLARSLVRDDARADDLVQDTYLTAMKNPPRHSRSLRAWLGAIVRNLARTQNRSEWRRTKHERIRPTKEAEIGVRPLPSPEETLEKAAWHQRLVQAAMQLEEPYRTTLLLRYFEELDSAEIARLQGVPAATVRTRVRRGLERLRAELDRTTPGGRAKWIAALLILARPPAEAVAAGTAAAATKPAVGWGVPLAGTAVLLVVVAAAAWLVTRKVNDMQSDGWRRHEGTYAGAMPEAGGETQPRTLQISEASFGHTLDVIVLDDGRPAAHASVVLSRAPDHPWRAVPREPWQAEQSTFADANGTLRFAGLTDGYWRVAAWRHGRARTLAYVHLPQAFAAPVAIDLAPQELRPLTLVDAATGRPLQGAIAWLEDEGGVPREPGPDRVVTNAEGRAELRGLAADEVAALRVAAPMHRGAHAVLPVATIALESKQRTVSWPIEGAWPIEGDAPPAATAVELVRPHGGERTPARIEGGLLVAGPLVDSDWPEHWALLPDGRFARIEAEAGRTQGAPIAFGEPVRVAVTIRDDRGQPVARVRLALADAATGTRLFERHETWTDADGEALLPVYAGDTVALLLRDRTRTHWRTLRTFDPTLRDSRVEVRLPRAQTIRIEMGELAEQDWALYAGRERVDPVREADGSFILLWRHWDDAETIDLHLLARGFEPMTQTFERTTARTWRVHARRASSLTVRVRHADASRSCRLALVDAATGTIVRRGAGRYLLDLGPDGVVRDVTLPAGRYLLLDLRSGKRSDPFIAHRGGGQVELDFDLTHAYPLPPSVTGRIVAPLGFDFDSTPLVALPGGIVAVGSDGSFSLPWVGPVDLQVAGQRIVVADSALPVRIDLLPIARVRCELPHAPTSGGTAPRVVATDAEGRSFVVEAHAVDGQFRFEGLAPGRWTLFFDLPGYAPAVRGDVLLEAGDNDLEKLALTRGSSLRLRVETRTGALPPALVVSAQAEAAPRYQRSISTQGEATFELAGLGAGRFRVTAWDRYTGLRVFTTSVECDGGSAREIAIPIR